MISAELVGRADAVEQVLAAFASAEAGETRHILVSGEAGVGKTRLLTRTGELVSERGGRVLLGGCVSMGDAALPFAPYAEIVRGLVAQDGAAETAALAGHSASDLARLVPSLGGDDHDPQAGAVGAVTPVRVVAGAVPAPRCSRAVTDPAGGPALG